MFRVSLLFFGMGLVICGGLPLAVATEDSPRTTGIYIEKWLQHRLPPSNKGQASLEGTRLSYVKNSISPRLSTASYRANLPPQFEDRGTNGNNGVPPAQGRSEGPHEGTLPPAALDRLIGTFQLLPPPIGFSEGSFPFLPRTPREPSLLEANRLPTLLMPATSLSSVGRFPTGPEGGFSRLEIEVSHSSHIFRLFGTSFFGRKALLYECRVGLGSPSFPTPRGIYFVTHIYDEDPWWIPPANRAWAWGQAPSRSVYGGTMAPLLKKRSVRSRRRGNNSQDDFVEGKVQLADYGYRFHGTNAPRSIGRNQSHGCVRMLSADARYVAGLIKEYVGAQYESESENGKYVVLKSPVRLNLVR